MEQRQIFLRDILTAIFKHKVLIVFLPLFIFALVFVGNYVWPPTYESVAKVRLTRGREVSQADPTVVTRSTQGLMMMQMGLEDLNSEIQIMHSKDLLERVVTELDLHNNPAFPYGSGPFQYPFQVVRQTVRNALVSLGLGKMSSAVQEAMEELDSRILTEPIRDSYVIEVRLRLGDPELAKRVLDKILSVYQELHIKVFENPHSSPFFEEQKRRAEQELTQLQLALQQFQKENNISLLESEQQLLLEQYTEAQKTLMQLAQTESVVSGSELGEEATQVLSSQMENSVVREMQLRLLELLMERKRVTQTLGPRHPTVETLEGQIRDAQQRLKEAIADTRKRTEAKLERIQARLAELAETKAKLQKMEKDLEIASKNYEYYSEKLEESLVADQLSKASITNVKVISSPTLPEEPIRPRKLLNLVVALIGGIMLALALAFFLEYLDHTLKTPEDVEHYLQVPALGSFFNRPKQTLDKNEALRVAALIETLLPESSAHVIEVCSVVSNENAGDLASALAEAYAADVDGHTLLVDFTQELAAKHADAHNITDLILGRLRVDSLPTSDKYTYLARGSDPTSSGYLWSSQRMASVVQQLKSRFKHIVFYTSPVLESGEAVKIAPHVDGVVIVAAAHVRRREVVQRAISLFGDMRNKILGVVLTQRKQIIPKSIYRRI